MLPAPSPTRFPYTTLFRSLVPTAHCGRPPGHLTSEVEEDPDLVGGFVAEVLLASQRGELPTDFDQIAGAVFGHLGGDRKSTRLNSSHVAISYAVFCLKKKN